MNLPTKVVMYFRVTYVQHNDKQDKCFIRGAVSKRESRNTYSVLSSVKINTTCTGLPSIPAKGEYWKVIGEAERYLEDHDGFGRHIFEFNAPTALEFQIPNTLEEVKCSGQLKLATVLEFSQYNRSDSLGVRPPLY